MQSQSCPSRASTTRSLTLVHVKVMRITDLGCVRKHLGLSFQECPDHHVWCGINSISKLRSAQHFAQLIVRQLQVHDPTALEVLCALHDGPAMPEHVVFHVLGPYLGVACHRFSCRCVHSNLDGHGFSHVLLLDFNPMTCDAAEHGE